MFLQRDDKPPPMTSQFALRVAILGGLALALFSIIFLRLWYVQVLSGDKYDEQAQNNRIREIRIAAPRGEILDRNGNVLVDNRTALELQVDTDELPRTPAERLELFERLGEVIGMTPERIKKEIEEQQIEAPAAPVTLKQDVRYELIYFLNEHQGEFPGVTVERVYVRNYPQGELAAHLFGYVREVSEDQLKTPKYERLVPGDTVGWSGLEYTYDHLLRGQDGATRIQVDAFGSPKGEPLSAREPVSGNNLILTLDEEVQAAGDDAIDDFGLPGAFVAMDVNTGAILAMGSYPRYDPAIYTRPISPQTYKSLTSEANDSPQTNRAISGLYPTGSTFKLITATAALEEGLISPSETIHDSGTFVLADGRELHNAQDAVYGTIAMRDALKVSSDVFFYELGRRAENEGGDPIQLWASRYGFGSPTGIDLPSEFGGLIPTPEWRNDLYEDELTDRPWSEGDSVNLAIGQGDLQATPLQLALAYATLANGGDVVRPHVAASVEDPTGRVIQEINPEPRRHVDIDPEVRSVIMDGLHAAAMEEDGTSYGVFGGWPVEVAGKTGTAERGTLEADQAWYAGMAPYEDPQVVVVATVEEGGFGASTAAPVVAQILQAALDVPESKIEAPDITGTYE
jgi:penicillin-binding protein 2